MLTVRNIRSNPTLGPNEFYVGRKNSTYSMPESRFKNPFPLTNESQRVDILLQFAEYWFSPNLHWLRKLAVARFPFDAVLVCWCVPKMCHADVIAGYVNAKRGGLI